MTLEEIKHSVIAGLLLAATAILPPVACLGNASTPSPQLFNSQPSNSQLFNFSTPSYTNHAGNAVLGWPVSLTATHVALAEHAATNDCQITTNDNNLSTFQLFNHSTTNAYPLSIFPEPEQRRIAADYVLGHPEAGVAALRVPAAVKRAVAGAEKAIARSRKRAEKGLCTKEESDEFCAKTSAALKSYLDKEVESGAITPAERKALGR